MLECQERTLRKAVQQEHYLFIRNTKSIEGGDETKSSTQRN